MSDTTPSTTPPIPTLAERLDAVKQRYEGGLGYWHVLTVEDAELVAQAFAADQVAQMGLRFATIEGARTKAERELVAMRALVLQGLAVVDDFLPNIGRCALQDYGRLNEFCIEARKLAPEPPAAEPKSKRKTFRPNPRPRDRG